MHIEKLKALIAVLKQSGIEEIELKTADDAVRVSRRLTTAAPVQAAPAPTSIAAIETPSAQAAPAAVLRAPRVGTFYRQDGAAKAPMVEVGQQVREGDTVCVIAAMRVMNPIQAQRSGTIAAVLVEDGQPVEYDQPLFELE